MISSGARHVAGLLFALVATGGASCAFWGIYLSSAFVVMAAVSIVAGCIIAFAGALFRFSSLTIGVTGAVVFLLLGVPLAVPGKAIAGVLPSLDGLISLLTGTALGWKQLVTISLPVGDYEALLVPAYLLILITAIVTTSIALRAPVPEWAVLGPLVLMTAGIVLGPGTAATTPVAVAVVLAASVCWLVWLRRGRRTAMIRRLAADSGLPPAASRTNVPVRSVLTGAAVLVVAGLAGGAAAVFVPAPAGRDVARTHLTRPFDPRAYPSPLSAFRSYLTEPTDGRAMLSVTGLRAGTFLRVATLDSYDGVVYAVAAGGEGSGSFERVPAPIDAGGGQSLHFDVTVDGYRGVWVPDAGMLGSVSFEGARVDELSGSFYYNHATGTAAVVDGLRRGDRYTVTARSLPERTAAELVDATPGSAKLPAVRVVPDSLEQTLRDWSGDADSAGAKLSAALTALAENGYISHGVGADEPASRSGHGADRITELLTSHPMVGDQEQYAVTAALMARQLGFPARVVFGFEVPETGDGDHATITGADVTAWVQIQTAGDGWVNVDPNPEVRPIPAKQPDEPEHVSRPQTNVQPPVEPQQPDDSDAPRSHVDDDRQATQPAWLTILLTVAQIAGWTLLAAAVLLAPFLVVIAAKWRRRRLRSRRGSPAGRIVGGWSEFADAAVDHGVTSAPSATRSEFAASVGGGRSLVLATIADRAVFSPGTPTDHDADQVWRAVAELRRSLGSGKTRWQRLRAAVSLRSVTGYRGHVRKNEEGR
jgi:hypothetical protein